MRVVSIERGSEADRAGLRPQDDLVAVAGEPIGDAVDLTFALGGHDPDEIVEFEYERGRQRQRARMRAARPEELGVELADDACRTCNNSCIFCFVDQLPAGLRQRLYVKDEDYRLSFSFGNYITLTNLSDADYARIARQRLSPLYVSVHATEDAVRRKMLGNPRAPSIMESLGRLSAAGIRVHAQIVVCPHVNDGPVLERTLSDLAALGDTVESVAVVPVGLTAHREGLSKVERVTPDVASSLIDTVERARKRLAVERGRSVVYAADELYVLAGREMPPFAEYDDFPQLENGVGLLRSFEAVFRERVADMPRNVPGRLRVSVVTGVLAGPFIADTIVPALESSAGLEVHVVEVENRFLGPTVTVAGLLSGADMARACEDIPVGELVLVPGAAFNQDGLTIDGMTVADIAGESGSESIVATHDVVGAILDVLEGTGRAGEGTWNTRP